MAEYHRIWDYVWVKEIEQVLRGQDIKGFISEKKDLVNDAWLNWEPEEIYGGGGDLLSELGAC